MEYGDLFKEHGGGELRYVPCLNDADMHLDFLTDLVSEHLHPWTDNVTTANQEANMDASRDRAAAMNSPV